MNVSVKFSYFELFYENTTSSKKAVFNFTLTPGIIEGNKNKSFSNCTSLSCFCSFLKYFT